jgi:hypothetical protein
VTLQRALDRTQYELNARLAELCERKTEVGSSVRAGPPPETGGDRESQGHGRPAYRPEDPGREQPFAGNGQSNAGERASAAENGGDLPTQA